MKFLNRMERFLTNNQGADNELLSRLIDAMNAFFDAKVTGDRDAAREARELAREVRQEIREQREEYLDQFREARQEAREALDAARDVVRELRQDLREAREAVREARSEGREAVLEARDVVREIRAEMREAREAVFEAREQLRDAREAFRDARDDWRDGTIEPPETPVEDIPEPEVLPPPVVDFEPQPEPTEPPPPDEPVVRDVRDPGGDFFVEEGQVQPEPAPVFPENLIGSDFLPDAKAPISDPNLIPPELLGEGGFDQPVDVTVDEEILA